MSHGDSATSIKLIKACYTAGMRIIEFAARTSNAEQVFKDIIAYAEKELPELIVGVGTIIKKPEAEKYIGLGASFVVAPIIDEEVGRYCVSKNIFWCPGAGTLTEIVNAHGMGADLVKIFPAETLGGAAFVRAIKGPCPWVNIMPTGGVTISEPNLQEWFDAGVKCVGIGSGLFSKQIIASENENEITAHISKLLSIINRVRGKE